MILLSDKLEFPDLSLAAKDGLLAIGADLAPERLILAYKSGIFPWFNEGEPVLWWSPNPRFVLFPKKLKISKSMKQVLRNNDFTVTINQDFESVIQACSSIKRFGQPGTWITQSMIDAYIKLHDLGVAKSVEVWQNKVLVGGLYGVDVGNGIFCGESMFAKISNASKVGFITFIQNSNYKLIDCQVYTQHLENFGAEEMERRKFLEYLGQNPNG